MFVTEELTPITVGENTMHIRAKLDYGAESRFMDRLRQIVGEGSLFDHLNEANRALMELCIVRWEGPAFLDAGGKPIPPTPEQIARLDPDEPLVEAVLREVNRRNPLWQQRPDPKAATNAGALPSAAPGSGAGVGTSTSNS